MTLQLTLIDAQLAQRPGSQPSATLHVAAANDMKTAASHRARRRLASEHEAADGDARHANIAAPKLATSAIQPLIERALPSPQSHCTTYPSFSSRLELET